jgi:aminoglycoside 6'-N-acetyltransferase
VKAVASSSCSIASLPVGRDFEGDWAWTLPSGARQPGEPPDAAAARELREETGLSLEIAPVADAPSDDVALFVAKAGRDAEITLDDEHDRYAWLPRDEAVARCLPGDVAACLTNVEAWLDAHSRGGAF